MYTTGSQYIHIIQCWSFATIIYIATNFVMSTVLSEPGSRNP